MEDSGKGCRKKGGEVVVMFDHGCQWLLMFSANSSLLLQLDSLLSFIATSDVE